jgi:RNA polymerase sigma-70 factor (ECF subfamily)
MLLRANPPKGGGAEPRGYGDTRVAMPAGPLATDASRLHWRPGFVVPWLFGSDSSGAPPPTPPAPTSETASFELLFRTYHSRLCAFAQRYVACPDTAEEVVEEVFLRIWAQRKFEEGCCDSPKRYLYTAVRNQALKVLDHERVVQRWRESARSLDHLPGMSQPPVAADERPHADRFAAALQQAIDGLPERCRQAYVLHRQQGTSQAEIAAMMGISVRTVETQLARAARALRQQLAVWLA